MFQTFLTAAAVALACAVFPRPASGGQELVAEALADLDRWLAGSRHEESWHTYLKTDFLRGELARPGSPDAENLAAVLDAYASGAPGLDRPQFVRTRRALEEWVALAALPRGKQLSSVAHSLSERYRSEKEHAAPARQFNAQVELLLNQSRQYAVEPSAALADTIGDSLDWLGRNGQADSLVLAVKQYYGHPNIWIRVPQEALADRIERPFDRSMRIRDRILGTSIAGSGRSRGTTAMRFEPGARQAVLNVVVSGTIDARTVGYNGPARIHSVSVTPFVAEKRLLLSEQGLEALPAVSRARTTTVTTGIRSTRPGLRGRLVARIARRRVTQTNARSDWIAARHAEQQISESIDEETKLMVRRLNWLVLGPFLQAARRTGRLPHRIQFRSAEGALFIGLVQGPLGAPPGEPDWSGGRTFAVQLHSSALDRLLGDRLQVTLRGNSFAAGDEPYEEPIDAIARYQLEEAPQGVHLVRQALDFLARGMFTPGKDDGRSDDGISKNEASENGASESLVGQVLSEVIASESIWIGSDELRLGTIGQLQIRDDWLTLGWNPPQARIARRLR